MLYVLPYLPVSFEIKSTHRTTLHFSGTLKHQNNKKHSMEGSLRNKVKYKEKQHQGAKWTTEANNRLKSA